MSDWMKRMLGFGMLALLVSSWAGVKVVELLIVFYAAPVSTTESTTNV